MGNPNRTQQNGPCRTCNANGGLWHGEPNTVNCMRPMDSHRHVMRGDQATRWTNPCWQPVTQPLPLDAVLELVRRC
ncbi:hypothetical protein [Piscinibacter gummiphilus]|uniref:Uncharacterized protein n=1 Tax=Piscinibacter gummiphilus TaxID=946333 RepID=A0ABZ0CZ38_9BURK|nr:hypothetical protein [Piscinibacter gummiphilus]WOB10224.1 hypothetical protein RXV79_09190 [Piscinibacter gummiphilus]